jgi:hypothetical protein
VPQFWLKPLGVTEPRAPMPNAWTSGAALDSFDFMTGPATPRQPPQMGRGDRVLFHAVIHVRVFAEGEILDNPRWERNPTWDLRWPWVYPCRVDAWVPLIDQGPSSPDIAPARALGRIQAGGDFASLSRAEHQAMLAALLAQPDVQKRR